MFHTSTIRRLSATVAVVAGAAFVLSGCGAITSSAGNAPSDGKFHLASYIQQKVDAGKPLVIKLSYANTALAFAKPIRDGMEKAGKKLGVDVQLIGPTGGDAAKQVAELQTLIEQKAVDGIAVSAASSDALKPVFQQAFDAGVPIISFGANNPNSKQMAFFGQDLAGAGKSQAKEVLKQLEAKGTKSGKIVVFSIDTGAGWSNDRFKGFASGIEGSKFEIVGPVNTGTEPSASFNVVQSTMSGISDPVAIAGLDCCTTTAAATWISQSGNTGKVLMAGFDLLPQTAEFVAKGVVTFTITQNPVGQGYQAVEALYNFISKGTPLKNTDTGAAFVTKDNLAQATVEG